MPWIVGIDEAGYGPNLGPLVMSAVACRVPEGVTGPDLWQVLSNGVRRAGDPADDRLLVDDSKLVYSTARGLRDLENGLFAIQADLISGGTVVLRDLVCRLGPDCAVELAEEIWYSGNTALPLACEREEVCRVAGCFARHASALQLSWGPVSSVVVCPPRFNRLLDRWDSKGSVLGMAMSELVNRVLSREESEEVCFFIDKHGGRNSYSAILQNNLKGGMVVVQEEGRERSVYSLLGLPQSVRFVVQPRADSEHLCVALASMVSKYLREALMREFNQFWQTHLPELKPTAGYPGDAARFFEQIREVARRLRIPDDALWRRR